MTPIEYTSLSNFFLIPLMFESLCNTPPLSLGDPRTPQTSGHRDLGGGYVYPPTPQAASVRASSPRAARRGRVQRVRASLLAQLQWECMQIGAGGARASAELEEYSRVQTST